VAAYPYHKWLYGVSFILADGLHSFGINSAFAIPSIRPDATPTGDYPPSLRFPWRAAIAAAVIETGGATGAILGRYPEINQ
jgi:hypothetical protein